MSEQLRPRSTVRVEEAQDTGESAAATNVAAHGKTWCKSMRGGIWLKLVERYVAFADTVQER